MAEVYWIHLPEHTDMFSEGYIGITSHTAERRFKSHVKESKRSSRKKYRIHNAIAKYMESIIVETLVICSMEYATELEQKLRPLPKIGWNTLAGGQNVKLLRDAKTNMNHSEESKKKMSEIHKRLWTDNPERLSKRLDGRKSLERPLDENGQPVDFWNKKYNRLRYEPRWLDSDKFYEYFKNNVSSVPSLIKHFGLLEEDRYWVTKMIRYFLGGWNPSEDKLWLKDFKQKEAMNGSQSIPSP